MSSGFVESELSHKIWLTCMQMSNCPLQQATAFLQSYHSYLNMPLTANKQTLLMVACSVGSKYLVRCALTYHPDLKLVDAVGRGPMHFAASVGCIEIFQMLAAAGCNPFAVTIGGQTPLSKACLFCQGDIIEWYLNNSLGAFEIQDKLGNKPLDILRINGEGLYAQVKEVYNELIKGQMIPE